MMSNQPRFWIGVSFLVVALGSSFSCHSQPPTLAERMPPHTLAERIRAVASSVNSWYKDYKIPKGYEQEVIGLASEPSGGLDKAFRSLDAERSQGHRPFYDGVWLTGTLITILAFDCPSITSRDNRVLGLLKSRLEPDGVAQWKQNTHNDQALAEWPWTKENGSWHLMPFDANFMGELEGEIAPRFEYYEAHFKRRRLT